MVFDNGTSQISLHANDSVVQGNGTEDGVDPSGSGEGFEVVGDDDQVIANVGFVETGLFLAGQRIQVRAKPSPGRSRRRLQRCRPRSLVLRRPARDRPGRRDRRQRDRDPDRGRGHGGLLERHRGRIEPRESRSELRRDPHRAGGWQPDRRSSGPGHVIARNLTAGVVVAGRSGFPEPQGHSILGNRMFRNFDPATFDPQPGIDLGDDGVTTNDLVDADAGPNGLQNHPVLTSVTRFIDNTFFEGSLHARPGRTYRIELYSTSTPHPSSHCEGEFFIGSVDVTADANGNALFPDPLGIPVASPGILFTATATDVLSGDTSEFAPCFQANGLPGTDVSLTKRADELVVPPGSSVTFLVTVHNRGPGEVSSLEVVDLLPAGLDWQTHLASQGSYDPGTGIWDVGDVPAPDEAHPEQVATLEIQALVTAAGGTLTNVAAIPPRASSTPTSATTAPRRIWRCGPAPTWSSPTPSPRRRPTWAGSSRSPLTVRNKGPEDAAGVKVFGFLPGELGAPVADAPETVGFRASDGLWTWDVGDLARQHPRALPERPTGDLPDGDAAARPVAGRRRVLGLLPTAARPDGGALALSDATYLLDTPPGLSITISGSGVAGSLAGAATPGFPFGIGEALFEFGGSVLSLDAGMLMGTGEELGNPLSFEADLALTPLGFVLPLNSVARIRVTPVGSEDLDVTLTLPFQVSAAVVADTGLAATLGLEGELVLTGSAIVPEPSTGALLLAALLTLATRRPGSIG